MKIRLLTPSLLKQEPISFRMLKGYLPPVITVHMFPHQPEKEQIVDQLKKVAAELNIHITPGYEGMQITL